MLEVGGVEDHVHALLGLKPSHCISDFVRELKKASSVWAQDKEPQFQWQEGYAIFAVSFSQMDSVIRYIRRQEEHHRKRTFVDELKDLLEKHKIKYDEKYLL